MIISWIIGSKNFLNHLFLVLGNKHKVIGVQEIIDSNIEFYKFIDNYQPGMN